FHVTGVQTCALPISTLESLAKMFPNLLEVQTDISFNKQVVKSFTHHYMRAAGKNMSDQELEQMLSAMQANQQIQRDGDMFKLSKIGRASCRERVWVV